MFCAFNLLGFVSPFTHNFPSYNAGLPLPPEAQKIRDSGPLTADSFRLILEQIRTGLTEANLSICQTSSHIAKLIPHM